MTKRGKANYEQNTRKQATLWMTSDDGKGEKKPKKQNNQKPKAELRNQTRISKGMRGQTEPAELTARKCTGD